uniref:Ig-like domain-containing protein n=1 Tax=Catharus ustulatus TaxID=91951 RepID=A0A8C3UV78_CATUS
GAWVAVTQAWPITSLSLLWTTPMHFPTRNCTLHPDVPGASGHPLWTCLGLLSVTGPSCPTEPLVLQVPARALLEGDTVTLRCRGWQDNPVTGVRFYKDEKDLQGSFRGSELSLPLLQLQHSGRYRCGAPQGWNPNVLTPPMPLLSGVRVTVPSPISFPELFSVPVLEGPPELPEGSPLNLSCLSTPSPLQPAAPLLYRFYRDRQLVGGPQGSSQLLVPAVEVSHSGNYSYQVSSEGGAVQKSSPSPIHGWSCPRGCPCQCSPPGDRGHWGTPGAELCGGHMGTGPLSFSWHREGLGTPLDTGPRLELRHIGDNDSGHYQWGGQQRGQCGQEPHTERHCPGCAGPSGRE